MKEEVAARRPFTCSVVPTFFYQMATLYVLSVLSPITIALPQHSTLGMLGWEGEIE